MNGEVQAIDWGAPIEAVHSGGRVIRVELIETDRDEPYTPRKIAPRLTNPDAWWFQEDGLWDTRRPSDWRIRNVSTPPQTPDVPPEVVTLTGEQANMLRKVLAWVKAVQGPFADEAAVCLALLDPVDADEAEAERVVAELYEADECRLGDADHAFALRVGRAAIKLGRELQSAPPKQGR